MANYEKLIKECDNELRAGQTQKVVQRLTKLNASRVQREWRLPLAMLCRRAGLHSRGLALLAPVANPDRSQIEPTPAEVAEYGVLLLRTGALNEALPTLESVDLASAPEALLYRAFLLFERFEFAEAIPLLEKYLAEPLDDYARLVGRVNLAFAYACDKRGADAKPLLDAMIMDHGRGENARIIGNCHSVRAQVSLLERRFQETRQDLEMASKLMSDAPAQDRVFLLKMRAFLEGMESGSTEPIDEFRMIAANADDFAGLREADLFSLRVRFDIVKYKHLIFGTPFESFRRQVFNEFGHKLEQQTYILGPKSSPRFDLLTGKIDGRDLLAPGRKCHQLFEVLLRDFYYPLRIGGLFSEMFPDEHFDVHSSPVRVRQLIRRARRWLESERIPVEICESRGFYSLRIVGDFSFRVPMHRKPVDFMHLHFEKLQVAFASTPTFTAKDVRDKLGFARTTVQRLVNWGLEIGKLERLGARNATEYRLTVRSTKAA